MLSGERIEFSSPPYEPSQLLDDLDTPRSVLLRSSGAQARKKTRRHVYLNSWYVNRMLIAAIFRIFASGWLDSQVDDEMIVQKLLPGHLPYHGPTLERQTGLSDAPKDEERPHKRVKIEMDPTQHQGRTFHMITQRSAHCHSLDSEPEDINRREGPPIVSTSQWWRSLDETLQELFQRVKALEQRNVALERENATLRQDFDELHAQLSSDGAGEASQRSEYE